LKFYCVAPMTCILRQNSQVDLSNCHFQNLLHPLHSLYIQLSGRKLSASLCQVRSAGYNVFIIVNPDHESFESVQQTTTS
jgi:archaellum component FlaF (FlaF/FlaG flagellin family)